MKLLTTNAKLLKQNGKSYLVTGLSLAPHSIGGHDVCESATAGCRSACVLWFSGRTVMKPVRDAMIARKQFLVSDPAGFEAQLCKEIESHERKARKSGLTPAVRLNVASDLDWSHIAKRFPNVKFYDYTKVYARAIRSASDEWPTNYELTFSRSEKTSNAQVSELLTLGVNVACVFATRYWPQGGRIDALPKRKRFNNRFPSVVDGDSFDVRLRELDGRGVVVGLRFKGSLKRRAAAVQNGFCLGIN